MQPRSPWRLGDLQELIVRASEAGDTSRVASLEKLRDALTALDALKTRLAHNELDPLPAIAEVSPAISEIFSCLSSIEGHAAGASPHFTGFFP